MIDATSFTGSAPASTDAQAGRTNLGRAEFMTLLLTQLQNQDPLNPLESHEFAAQLADFTSVDELGQINTALASQLENMQYASVLSETSFSAALVGKRILAEGDRFCVTDRRSVEITVDVADAGGSARLRIYDEDGFEIASRDIGNLAGGRQAIEIPDDLDNGTYRYELEVTDGDGNDVAVTSYVAGQVDRVLFRNGAIGLVVNGITVGLGALIEINGDGSNEG